MQKKCYRCKQEKEIECFSIHKSKKDGRNDYCKECNRAYNKEHYQRKRDTYLAKEKQRRQELTEWLRGIRQELKCEKCGEDHPGCLDFHHKDPSLKDLNVSSMVKGYSKERILAEIEKCHVWCSNCHRKFHWEEIHGPVV